MPEARPSGRDICCCMGRADVVGLAWSGGLRLSLVVVGGPARPGVPPAATDAAVKAAGALKTLSDRLGRSPASICFCMGDVISCGCLGELDSTLGKDALCEVVFEAELILFCDLVKMFVEGYEVTSLVRLARLPPLSIVEAF